MKELSKAGDLIFYRVNPRSVKDRVIGFLEHLLGGGSGKYCHVSMLDATLDYQYEAALPKIRRSKVDWTDPQLELWRIKDAEDTQLKSMLDASITEVGYWYGLGESLKYLLKKGRLTICTQYVIDSAAQGYINLAEDKGDRLVSPDELSSYKSIYRVG